MASAFIGFVRPVSALDGDDLNRYVPKQTVDLLAYPLYDSSGNLLSELEVEVAIGGSYGLRLPNDIFARCFAIAFWGNAPSSVNLNSCYSDGSLAVTTNPSDYYVIGNVTYLIYYPSSDSFAENDYFEFVFYNYSGSTQDYEVAGLWALDSTDVSDTYFSFQYDFWQAGDNAVTGTVTGSFSSGFNSFPGSNREEYQAQFTYTGQSLGRVRIAVQTVNANIDNLTSQIPYELISTSVTNDGVTALYTYVIEFEYVGSFNFSFTGMETMNGGVTPASIAYRSWTYSPIVDYPQVAWNRLLASHLDNMGGQLANIWTLVSSRFSDLSGWISAQTDSLVAILNGWLESIDTQIYTFRSMVDGWFTDLWESLEGIRNAIIGDANDLSNSQDYEDSAASNATEASGLVGELDDVTKPPSDEVNTDIDDYVSADGMEMYGDMLNPILSNQYILNILVLSITLMIGSYILFGKR